jgi:manganese transport protein
MSPSQTGAAPQLAAATPCALAGDAKRPARAVRRLLATLGPAILVSVGYMDPGNWATDLEAGARFGTELLWVLVLSNVMALLFQSLSARLRIATGLDLASGCREEYPDSLNKTLWVLAELGIIACDLAEVLGSAIGLNLLFGIPLLAGALLTSLDVLLLLALQRRGMRYLTAAVLALLATVSVCMLIEVGIAAPQPAALLHGLVPRLNGASLYVAVGILGATVMPHNLYLHSALAPQVSAPAEKRAALRSSLWTTGLALNLALLVNAAILVLAASVFGQRGLTVTDLHEEHRMLLPLLGSQLAPYLFAIGLLCAGQSATISGTLAGQIVMDGFLRLRVSPSLRRVVTRGLAIVPAVAVLAIVGDGGVMSLLIASQVILSLQLPFAVVPLIRLSSSAKLMGVHRSSSPMRALVVACALLIIAANGALVVHIVAELRAHSPLSATLLASLACAGVALLCVIATVPLRSARRLIIRTTKSSARTPLRLPH